MIEFFLKLGLYASLRDLYLSIKRLAIYSSSSSRDTYLLSLLATILSSPQVSLPEYCRLNDNNEE